MNRRSIFYPLLTGLFMLGVFSALIFFSVVISGADLFSSRGRREWSVVFRDVGGLRKNDNVVLRGMSVGSVRSLSLSRDGVVVKLLLDPDVAPREDSTLSVEPTSLLGGHYLKMSEGRGRVLESGEAIRGLPPDDVLGELKASVKEIREALSRGGVGETLANVNRISVSLSNLVVRVERGEGTLGKLFSEDTSLYDSLAAAAGNLKGLSEKLARGESTLGRLLNDQGGPYEDLKQAASDVKQLTADLKTVSGRLASGEGTLGKLLSDDGSTFETLRTTAADLQTVAANLKGLTTRLEQGEGSLGKLANDPELYDELLGTLKDARQVIDNFRDTAPITTFSSILFGAL
ncbi:MAG: MlaD family protein [Kiritimatiellia bacterium]